MNYPRPKPDSGLGIHLSSDGQYPCGVSQDEVRMSIDMLKQMGFSWVKPLVVEPYTGDHMKWTIDQFVKAGFEVVLRLYVQGPYPAIAAEGWYKRIQDAVRAYVDLGVHYFELRNEPNLQVEWASSTAWNAYGNLQARAEHAAQSFLSDAYVIQKAGGIPLTPALAPGGGQEDDELYWPIMCRWWKNNGGTSILQSSAIAVHNYMWNHPLDYPYDKTNQQEHPGHHLWSGAGASNGFLKYRYMVRVFQEILGFTIPILSTEDGASLNSRDDNRYAQIDQPLHRERHLQVARFMASEAETEYLCTAFWLWGASVLGAHDSPWEGSVWRSVYRELPIIAALKERGFVARTNQPWAFDKEIARNVVDSLPKHATLRYEERPIDDIRRICVHHSAAGGMVSPEAIARYHVSNKWPGIGYHFYVLADGTIYQTNYLRTVSYHAGETGNRESISICFAGDFTQYLPSPQQMESGQTLMRFLLTELGLDPAFVVPHSYYVSTTVCPAGDWWRALLPTKPEPQVTPAEAVEQAIREVAWTAIGIPLNEESAFWKFAHANGLGVPHTAERDVKILGKDHRLQGFAKAIAYCEVGDWANVKMTSW